MTTKYSNLDQVAEAVTEQDGGPLRVTMAQLRDAIHYERLSNPALGKIREGLRQRALGHYPELTLERHDEIRVFRVGTPVGNLIEAVLFPTQAGDTALKDAASNEAAQIVREVRDLVCG